jgi:hypothetical protein
MLLNAEEEGGGGSGAVPGEDWPNPDGWVLDKEYIKGDGDSSINHSTFIDHINQTGGFDRVNSIAFNEDGTICIATAWNSDEVGSYTLSIPWDISNDSCTATGSSNSTTALPGICAWGTDGTTYYFRASTDTCYEFTCAGDPYIITEADVQTDTVTDTEMGHSTSTDGFSCYPPTGDRLLWCVVLAGDPADELVATGILSTPNDLSTMGTVTYQSINSILNSIGVETQGQMLVSEDGLAMYWAIKGSGLRKFSMTSAFDFSTLAEIDSADAFFNHDSMAIASDASALFGTTKFSGNVKRYIPV